MTSPARRSRRQAPDKHELRDPSRQKEPQTSENHAQIDAELCLFRREMYVESDGIELMESLPVEGSAALQNGSGNSGDGEHGEKGHLEAGIKQRFGLDHKSEESRRSDCIQRIAFAVKQPREHINSAHQGSPLHRRA
jgi:hypothetical protein